MTLKKRMEYILRGIGMTLQICPEQVRAISEYSGSESLEEYVSRVWEEDWKKVTGRKAHGN